MAFKQFAPRTTPNTSSDLSQNRQESHRIYLQVFAPHSAKAPTASSSTPATIHRHDSHEIHPPSYPITAPGAPYQFPSSDSSTSTFASYAFSSMSVTPGSSVTETTATTHATDRKSKPPKPRYIGYPSTSTTSAAVRLTDRAKSKDVTALLRGKFGLPPTVSHVASTDRNVSNMQQVHHVYNSRRNNKLQSRSSFSSPTTTNGDLEEIDVLVLVGTIDRPPLGYVRFEHEEMLEELNRLECFRNAKYCDGRSKAEMAVSASADTIRASGGDRGIALPAIDYTKTGRGSSSDFGNVSSGASAIGLDLSSSRGNVLRGTTTSWGSVAGGHENASGAMKPPVVEVPIMEPKSRENASPSKIGEGRVLSPSNKRAPSLDYEYDSEPIHIVRTVHPEEHPLQVRDEMMKTLIQLRREAEDEMGLRLHINEESESLLGQQLAKPTFRWFFQPCSALGGSGLSHNSSKIQSIPSYIDLEGYCTGEEESDDDDSEVDDGNVDIDECKDDEPLVTAMERLAKERRHIAVLRDLADPTFVVSGYLLKQSSRDPNVWRRVYCVLGEDRLWVIRRMKTLATSSDLGNNLLGNEDIMSSLRIGRHSYIKLHRSLLLESGDGASESKQEKNHFVSPLGRRLPNTFRIITVEGSTHSFRAFNAPSFRVWSSTLADKITLNHCNGLMDLANVIAQDEASARCKRLEDVSVTPLLDKMNLNNKSIADFNLPPLSADVTRFGISIAEFRELCRHTSNAIQSQRHFGTRDIPFLQRQNASMVAAVWEDARVVASKSAQLLHTFAARQHSRDKKEQNQNMCNSEQQETISSLMDMLLKEQKALQIRLGKRWDAYDRSAPQRTTREAASDENYLTLPPMNLFDSLLDMFQSVCAAMCDTPFQNR